jgi:hypothetical protein
MYVLSIDVGIKNLAYCLLKITDKDIFEISEWRIVNLCGEIPLCQGKTKKKDCKKIAKVTKENQYFCKIHAKSQSYKLLTPELELQNLKKLNLMELCKKCESYEIPYQKPITKTKLINNINLYIQKYYFDKIIDINSKNCDFITLGRNLKNIFSPFMDKYSIDIVLIENQLSPLANRMKTLQGMISQFFIMYDIPTIKYISAINKLKSFIGNKKTTYNERKKLGIEYCKNIISKQVQFKSWETFLSSQKKIDDFADSFLQGLYYLNANNLINMNLDLIKNDKN